MSKKSSQAKGPPVQSRVATAPLLRVAGRYVRKDGNEPRILALCAETGMGKSSFKSRLGDLNERGVTLKKGQTLKSLYNERVPLYKKYADITVNELQP